MGFAHNSAAVANTWVPVSFLLERLEVRPLPVVAVEGGVLPHGIHYKPFRRLTASTASTPALGVERLRPSAAVATWVELSLEEG